MTKQAIRELKSIKYPEDFSPDHAYNLVHAAFSLFITQGMNPDDIKQTLHTIVDEAHNDLLEQVKEMEDKVKKKIEKHRLL